VVNILEKYFELYDSWPDIVITGFHMRRACDRDYTEDDFADIRGTAEWLRDKPVTIFTGHCTGTLPFRLMKEIMGERLLCMHSGDTIL